MLMLISLPFCIYPYEWRVHDIIKLEMQLIYKKYCVVVIPLHSTTYGGVCRVFVSWSYVRARCGLVSHLGRCCLLTALPLFSLLTVTLLSFCQFLISSAVAFQRFCRFFIFSSTVALAQVFPFLLVFYFVTLWWIWHVLCYKKIHSLFHSLFS